MRSKYFPMQICFLLGFFISIGTLSAQKVGFISSDVIRKNFLEAQQAEQRIQSIVDEWKRELDFQQKEIDALEFEIQKNRLVWSDQERIQKETEMEEKKKNRNAYAKVKFEPAGEYDDAVKVIMGPVEQKIFAAVQKIASEDGYDIIWDQSVQPLPYTNFKYDLTVKVLRSLGVDVSALEKELQEKIDKDPRNQKKESTTPRKKSRTKTTKPTPEDREVEREEPVIPPDPMNMQPDTTKK